MRGSDIATEVGHVAREKNAGSVVVGHPRKGRLARLLRGSNTEKLLHLADEVDVYVVADREESPSALTARPPD